MNAFNPVVAQATRRLQRTQEAPSAPAPMRLSRYSSALVPNGGWCSEEFLLGAGMVLIQQNTHKVVLLYERKRNYWFLPRGRKDIGESLGQTALREAYEESGYRAEFFPSYALTRQPPPPTDREERYRTNTEPIFMSMTSWEPQSRNDNGGEYFVSWYLGKIAEDAQPDDGTRMADEQDYVTHLLSIHDAKQKVFGQEVNVLNYAWDVYVHTLAMQRKIKTENAAAADAVNNQEGESEWVTESSDEESPSTK